MQITDASRFVIGGMAPRSDKSSASAHLRQRASGVKAMDEVLDREIVAAVRRFVERDVIPNASALEHRDEYPHAMVSTMRELGLFGATIPAEFGGLGLSFLTYARVMEELSRGWMSLAGVINSHLIMAHVIANHGTDAQKKYFLPAMARGEKRGGLALTEPHAGSDVQSIRTTATRRGDDYILTGSKMFITNARHGTMLAVAAKTNPHADPAYAGISMFAVEKSDRGPTVSRNLDKLGYKGIDTCEVLFEDVPVAAANLIGGVEGAGFKQVMSALEVGRINVAARAVGVGQAAFETAIRYAQQRTAFGKPICQHQAVQLMLADMATRVEAARLLVANAARMKDANERCDVEAGMAKLFASEACAKISLDAMRVLGGYGFMADFPVERFYRDAPLMLIGEGTNEIQALVIARGLLARYAI
jgi:alkylation response protein AidB-like acyl-CoA dehydrogenase